MATWTQTSRSSSVWGDGTLHASTFTNVPRTPSYLLLENGSYLLLETGDKIVLDTSGSSSWTNQTEH